MEEYIGSLTLDQIGQILGGAETPYNIDPNELYSGIAKRLNEVASAEAQKRGIQLTPEEIQFLIDDSPRVMGLASKLDYMGFHGVVRVMVRQRDPFTVNSLEQLASKPIEPNNKV